MHSIHDPIMYIHTIDPSVYLESMYRRIPKVNSKYLKLLTEMHVLPIKADVVHFIVVCLCGRNSLLEHDSLRFFQNILQKVWRTGGKLT